MVDPIHNIELNILAKTINTILLIVFGRRQDVTMERRHQYRDKKLLTNIFFCLVTIFKTEMLVTSDNSTLISTKYSVCYEY